MQKILVIGTGSIGERHVRCFQQTGRAEVAICEINPELRAQIQKKYGLSNAYPEMKDVPDDSIDAAIICTPAHLHIPMALDLLRNGTGVLIEKPLSTALTRVDEFLTLTNESATAASVAYVMRNHPAMQAMREYLAGGESGRPVQIVYSGGQHFPFYRPAYRQIYYTKHETGGGAIQDALTHIMNAAEWLVGPVTRLCADAEHCVLEGVEVEDTVHVMTRHDTVLGSFSLNQHQPVNEATLTVLCESGSVRFESHHSRWLTCRDNNGTWDVREQFDLERDDLFVKQAHAFIDQLDGCAPPVCSPAEAAQTLKVNLAILKSVREQQWVTL